MQHQRRLAFVDVSTNANPQPGLAHNSRRCRSPDSRNAAIELVIGAIELVVGVLLAVRPRWPRDSVLGSLAAADNGLPHHLELPLQHTEPLARLARLCHEGAA